MYTQISLRFWLLIAATVLGIAACTAKLQRSTQPNQATASNTPQTAQSAKANEKIDTTLTLEKLRRTDYPAFYRAPDEYYLDTAITNHLPHFNAQELLTYYRFLFDLGKEDSMYCERCNDSARIKRGGNAYYYQYYYKKVLVTGGNIDLQTNYGDNKIYRVRVRYERLKDFDVIPRTTIKEAATAALKAACQAKEEAGIACHIPDTYTDVVLDMAIKNYYRGLRISATVPPQLSHYFQIQYEWNTWVYDISGYGWCKRSGDYLCNTCDFSTASYTTQTVPTYHNANFNYGNVPLEVQECAYTLADGNMVKRYRLQQNANPFHVVYYSEASDADTPPTQGYEEADWYSVANLSQIDPAITVKKIKTTNGVISATVTGLVTTTVSPLTNNMYVRRKKTNLRFR